MMLDGKVNSEWSRGGPVDDLATLRARHEALKVVFDATVDREFPGRNEWDWFRADPKSIALGHRRNDDISDDAALAANVAIRDAWDAYIKALHQFYRARDGEHGVLGGRGL